MVYKLLSQSSKLNKQGLLIRAGGMEVFWKKNKRGEDAYKGPKRISSYNVKLIHERDVAFHIAL